MPSIPRVRRQLRLRLDSCRYQLPVARLLFTKARRDVGWNLDRAHGLAVALADAGNLHRAGRDSLAAVLDHARVGDRPAGDLGDPDRDLELVLESQRAVKLARRRNTRPADLRHRRMNAQPRFAPQRVLDFLHVAEEPAE